MKALKMLSWLSHGRPGLQVSWLLPIVAVTVICAECAAASADVNVQPTSLTINCTGGAVGESQSGGTLADGPDATPQGTLNLSDPNAVLGDVQSNQITIRFKAAKAAALHAHRMTIAPHDRGRWMDSAAPAGLARMPAAVRGMRPQASGHAKALRMIKSHAQLGADAAVIAGGKALAANRSPAVSNALVQAFKPADPMGIFYAQVVPGTDLRALCLDLMKRPDVVYATPSPLVRMAVVPNDPLYPRMWNLPMINMPAAWDFSGNTLATVRVCLVDSGVRITHSDLVGRTADPADVYLDNGDAFADADPNNDDPDGHGTACAGIFGAIRGNGLLVPGIAPVTIIPVNGYYSDGTNVYIANYTDGIFWGVDHGANVISLSIGGNYPEPYPEEVDAINYAQAHGVVVCAAAGNDDGTAVNTYPGALPYCIQVGAVDQDGLRVTQPRWWWGSNYGSTLDICAPGQGDVGLWDSILTLGSFSNTSYISYFNGTSAATPHVAGLAALLKHINPALTASQIRSCIESTAQDQVGEPSEDTPGRDPYHGYGLINATAAAQCARDGGNCVLITNTGSASLQVSAIDAPSWANVSPAAPFTIPVGGYQPVSVTACGQCVGSALDGTLFVHSNDPDEPTVAVSLHVDCASCQPLFNCQASAEAVLLGESTVLSAAPGGSDTVEWFTESCGGTPVPGGASPTVSPTEPTTYYARSKNLADECVNSECCSVTVGVISGDLTVSALSGPSVSGAGRTPTFTVATRNGTSSTLAGASITRLYWSLDATLSADDPEIANCGVPALDTGQSSPCSLPVTIAPETAAGTYYVIAKADADNVVTETNETNNTKNLTIKIGPDLTVSTLTGPSESGAGQTITVTATVKNGTTASPAGAFVTRLYWSTDNTLDSGDAEVKACSVAGLDPGQSTECQVTLDVPLDTAPATYYVFAKADADGAVPETSETNNTSYRSVKVGPDLSVLSLTAPSFSGAGQTITITAIIKNDTTASPTGAFLTRLHWSTDNILDSGDSVIETCSVAGLAPGQSTECQKMLTISPDTAPASYYIIVKADTEDTVPSEISETNNHRTMLINVGPDLSVSSLTGPSTSGAGQTITVTATVKNGATASPAGAFFTRMYWSSDTTLDSGDAEIGACSVVGLSPGQSVECRITRLIPLDTAPASYYVIAKADADNAVPSEISESNNVRTLLVKVGSDLTVTSLTGPSESGVGQAFTVTATIQNGTATSPAGAFVTRLYWSTDNILDSGDSEIEACSVAGLAPGQSTECQKTLTISPDIAPAAYYIIAKADDDDAVPSEISETNNVKNLLVKIGADLSVPSLTAPSASGAGQTITITATIKNGATASPASPFVTGLYLSADNTLDSDDSGIGSCSVAGLAPGQSAGCQATLAIPLDTPPAAYYIIAYADDGDAVPSEISETNNLKSLSIKIGADLSVPTLSAPSESGAGQLITVTATVKNGTTASPSGAFVTRLYWSANSTLDPLDPEIGSCSVVGLNAGQSTQCQVTLPIPVDTAPATYYIIARADDDDTVPSEISETNNTLTRSIKIGPDLSIPTVTAPSSGTSGQTITVTATVKNGATASPAGASFVRLYWSANAAIDASDLEIGSSSIAGLSPGESASRSFQVTVPSLSVRTVYYIIAKADANGTLVETNEVNNTKARSILAGP